jgi:hypothetical protein
MERTAPITPAGVGRPHQEMRGLDDRAFVVARSSRGRDNGARSAWDHARRFRRAVLSG